MIAVLLMATDAQPPAFAAAILLCLFSVFLYYLNRQAPSLPCGCLGDMPGSDHRVGISRNVVLILLLIFAGTGSHHPFGLVGLSTGAELAVLVALATEGVYLVHSIRVVEGA